MKENAVFFAAVKGQKGRAKKIKIFLKKVLTNGKSFGIIDKPTSGGSFRARHLLFEN